MNILICPDSFKGSANAQTAAEAIQFGCKKVYPKANYTVIPLADGGEGSAAIIAKAWNWHILNLIISTRPISVFRNDEYTEAIFDMAELCGIDKLENGQISSLDLNTQTIGELILLLKTKGIKHITICLGGSGTCDAGIGAAAVLGYKFLNEQGIEIVPIPRNLGLIKQIEKPEISPLEGLDIHALYDVKAPLFGENGTALNYGSQKGLNEQEIQKLDEDLREFSLLAKNTFGLNISKIEGTGAAGGLGFGLMLFAKTKMQAGAPFIMEAIDFEQQLKKANLVITGEGKIDKQTGEGKVISQIVHLGEKHEKPVFAICGSVESEDTAGELGLSGLIQIIGPDVDLSDAIKRVEFHLSDCAYTLANYLSQNE